MARNSKHTIKCRGWLTFGTFREEYRKVCLEYYESYEPGQVHYFLEIVGTMQELQNIRTRLPSSPSCGCNNHLSTNTLEVCTISLKYTPWKEAASIPHGRNQSLLTWLDRLWLKYFRYESRLDFWWRFFNWYLRFDVSMENAVAVHVIDGFEHLIHVILDSLLWKIVSPTFDCLIHVHVHKLEN